MTQHKDETAIEYMRRIVNNLNYEPESLLEDLETIPALVEYFELWDAYDTDFAAGCQELIEYGEYSPKAWNAFVRKHNVPWVTYTSKGKRIEEGK